MTLKPPANAPITCSDWGDLVDEDGFLALGRNRYHCSYVIYTDGAWYYAENGTTGALDFGGPNNRGGVSGLSAAAVINAAIAAIGAAGGNVKVKAGTYSISTPILINTGGITLEGTLSSLYDPVTVFTLADGVDDSIIKVDTRASGITMSIRIANLRLYGNAANQTAGHGIFMDGPAWSEIENIELHSIFADGIHIEGAAGAGYNQVLDINKIRVRGGIGDHAISVTEIADSWIRNCDLHSTNDVMDITGQGIMIINNNCYLGAIGIMLNPGSHYNTIAGNRCNDNTNDGIQLDSGNFNVATDNFLDANGRDGIRSNGIDNIITENRIQTSVQTGIYCSESRNIITSNSIIESGRWGILATDTSMTIIADNEIINNGQEAANTYDGILIDQFAETVEFCVVSGNMCLDNQGVGATQRDGIQIDNEVDDCLVTDNICKDNTRYGIYIAGANADRNLVKDNLLDGNGTLPFRDDGTATKLATIKGDFPISNIGGGTTTTAPVINTSPGGVDIDNNDEFCYVHIPLPAELQLVIRIKLWAYSNVIEANAMRLRIVAHGATGSEQWNLNPIDVVNHPSEDDTLAANDVVHWVIDAGDDAQVGTLAAQDLVELMAVGEVAGDGDCATDALFGGYEIEYV